MITREDMQRVAETLDGTCRSLDDVLEEELGVEFSDVPLDMLVELDEMVLDCTCCGWWSEASEFDDDQVCPECQEQD